MRHLLSEVGVKKVLDCLQLWVEAMILAILGIGFYSCTREWRDCERVGIALQQLLI